MPTRAAFKAAATPSSMLDQWAQSSFSISRRRIRVRSVFALNSELLSSLNAEGRVSPSRAKLLTSWKPDVPAAPLQCTALCTHCAAHSQASQRAPRPCISIYATIFPSFGGVPDQNDALCWPLNCVASRDVSHELGQSQLNHPTSDHRGSVSEDNISEVHRRFCDP